MSSDVGEVTESLENEHQWRHVMGVLHMGGSPGDVSENPVT